MLVLSRGEEESILIGDIKITVVRISHGKVRLGITAGPEYKILREELVGKPPGPKKGKK